MIHMILPLSLLALVLGACSEPSLNVYDVPKESDASPQTESSRQDVSWEAPSRWKKQPASGMRLATYLIASRAGQAELSVVRLAGEAGGDLANVNRWRGQIGLAPLDSLEGHVRKIPSAAGEVRWVDFAGEQEKRMLGAVLADGSGSLFFKLTGSKAAVSEVKPAFLAFLRSLHRGRP